MKAILLDGSHAHDLTGERVRGALERVAADQRSRRESHRPMFAVLTTCGFPGAHHTGTATALGGH